MRATPGAEHLSPYHSMTPVELLDYVQRRDWLIVTGPARPRLELGGTAKKVGVTAYTLEDSRFMECIKGAGTRNFRTLPGRDFILMLGQ